MADKHAARLPVPSAEHHRIAAGQFERANQVIATGNHDYGIRLLLSCCKLEPGNLTYRQALRRTEKTKYKNNMRGSSLAFLRSWTTRAKIKAAKRSGDYIKVLEYGEIILTSNPWDVGTQMDMAAAADALGQLDLAIWLLEQTRQKNPRDPHVNRPLARLYERRGNFAQAIALWELVRKAQPQDIEAQHKAKDLAANETIQRGRYVEATVGGGADDDADEEDAGAEDDVVPEPAAPAATTAQQDRVSREAAPLLQKIKADASNPNPYLHLAAFYRRADQLERAREVLNQGLKPTGNNFELVAELADVEIEPFRQNLAVVEEKLRADANDDELRKLKIRLMKEINTRELELFRQKADRYPTELGNKFELGVRLLRSGQIDEAIQALQASRADPKHFWRSLLYLGYCFKGRNNWRLAQRNFEEALQNLPANEDGPRKEILYQLATGSADAGDKDIGRLLDEWQNRLDQAKVS